MTMTSAGALAACASRGPRPTTQTVDLRKLAFLPIKEVAPKGKTGPFNYALVTPAVTGSVPPPISPGLLGMAIGQALRNSSEAAAAASRLAIGTALQPVAFSPRQVLSEALSAQFAKRSVPVEPFTDERISEVARTDWDFSKLPAGFDALLDIQIPYAGYFAEKEAGGFSPTVYVTTRILATSGGGAILEKFYYEADYRDAEGETRFFTTPKQLNTASLAQFGERSQAIREGMTSVFATIAEKMADDIDRAVKKLPKTK